MCHVSNFEVQEGDVSHCRIKMLTVGKEGPMINFHCWMSYVPSSFVSKVIILEDNFLKCRHFDDIYLFKKKEQPSFGHIKNVFF